MQKDDRLAKTYYSETVFPSMIAEILFCDPTLNNKRIQNNMISLQKEEGAKYTHVFFFLFENKPK